MINQLYQQYSDYASHAWGLQYTAYHRYSAFTSNPDKNHTQYKWLNDDQAEEKIRQGLSAYVALEDAFVSIASRIHLIRNAQNSIDLQYYLWKDDFVGKLILSELLKAADRGVTIRLLVDDQNGVKLDQVFKTLALHSNFKVRLFNPYRFRHVRLLDLLFRFKKVNRRMHNKQIIADASIVVAGGRNISSEYFDACEKFQFTDLDILFYGDAVKKAQDCFQTFWDSPLSQDIDMHVGQTFIHQLAELRQYYYHLEFPTNPHDDKLLQAQVHIQKVLQQEPIQWVKAHFVADSPNKTLGTAKLNELLYDQLLNVISTPKKHIELTSAYFVPTKEGTNYLKQLSQQGVKVRILTNSLAANDVAIVHSFYSQYRLDLLQHGIEIYEFKPNIEKFQQTWYEMATGHVLQNKRKRRSSLHAKFFDVDHKVFIGSFNFDPRSVYLNTEMGLVIESKDLQHRIVQRLDEYLPQVAYQLKLNDQGQIYWIDHHITGEQYTFHHEPHTNTGQRMISKVLSYLPIEWMM